MPDLSPSISEAVHAACTVGAQEVAEAFSRALGCQTALQIELPDPIAIGQLPGELGGPGLVVVLHVGQAAALVLLPESSGLLPPWYASPDATGQSKLSTLAQELGMLLLPEDLAVERSEWVRVANLADALRAAGVAEGAVMIPMPATTDDGRRGVARLVWPAAKPGQVGQAAAEPVAPTPQAAPKKPGVGGSAAAKPQHRRSTRPMALDALPIYSRSLLRVKVPVVVTLAQKRQPVSRIVELGPGCILQFDKSCEEMLDLYLGNRRIANGEAVKVGDKFGLRITSIVLPEERFHPLKKA